MKRTFWLGLSGVVVLSLTGCYNIYTTSDNPVQDMRLRGSVRVTGFDLSVPVEQVTSKSEGKANATSGDKSADAKGAATSERTRYVYLNNGHQAVGETLRKYLEERGLNVRSDKPLPLKKSLLPFLCRSVPKLNAFVSSIWTLNGLWCFTMPWKTQ